MYVFVYSSFNGAVNDEDYVSLNERMINERLISCSVKLAVFGIYTYGRMDGRKETMKCFSAAGRVLETKVF